MKKEAGEWAEPGQVHYQLAEVVWARVGNYSWWPALVTKDPDKNLHSRPKRLGKGPPKWEHHVSFFGEPNRAWMVSKYEFSVVLGCPVPM